MKLCFSTLMCLGASADRVLRLACDNGIDGVEIRMDGDNVFFDGNTIADAARIKADFARAGVAIVDVASSVTVREYDEKKQSSARAALDTTAALGAKGMRVFLSSPDPENPPEGMIRALRELADYAPQTELWLETHSEYSLGRTMAHVVKLVDRPNVKVIWDLIHTVEFGEAPHDTAAFLKDMVAHIHLKDGVPQAGTTQFLHTDLGKGTVPVAAMRKELEALGFNGYLSLEWESPWRPEIRDLYPDLNVLLQNFLKFAGESAKGNL